MRLALYASGTLLALGSAYGLGIGSGDASAGALVTRGFSTPGYSTSEFRFSRSETISIARGDYHHAISVSANVLAHTTNTAQLAQLEPLVKAQSAQAVKHNSCVAIGIGTAPNTAPITYVAAYKTPRLCPA